MGQNKELRMDILEWADIFKWRAKTKQQGWLWICDSETTINPDTIKIHSFVH